MGQAPGYVPDDDVDAAMTAGRKPKLTPEVQAAICQAIRAGNYNGVAANYAGIGESTFYLWMAQGEQAKSGPKLEFLEAIKKAESDAETRNVALIETAANQSWQAAAWWLERKHNERWGRKERQEVTGEKGGPIQIQTELTPKQLEEYADVIREVASRRVAAEGSTNDDDPGESIHSPAPEP